MTDLAYILKNLPKEWPPEYAKPIFVVPDIMVDAMREAFGDSARVVPISETMLPLTAPEATFTETFGCTPVAGDPIRRCSNMAHKRYAMTDCTECSTNDRPAKP
jgi:hypothetical protein